MDVLVLSIILTLGVAWIIYGCFSLNASTRGIVLLGEETGGVGRKSIVLRPKQAGQPGVFA
jgi:hypothetical protein